MIPAPTVTFFRNYTAAEKWERPVALDALAERIKTTFAPSKSELPWLKLARFGNAKTAAGSLRHDANVIACTGVEADYDGGKLGVDYAIEIAEKEGLLALIYTSPSHTPDGPRWRVLAPASHEVPPAGRAHLLGRLNGLYRGIFARESWTLSQAYYYGAVQDRYHRVELIDGLPIDRLDELDTIWQGPPGTEAGTKTDAGIDAREDGEIIRRIVTGDGLHTELCALAARYIGRGVPADATSEILRGMMLAHPEGARDARWHDRFRSIAGIIASARRKYADGAESRRAVARVTHQLAQRSRPVDEIKAAVLAEAERCRLNADEALAIADRILSEKAARGRNA